MDVSASNKFATTQSDRSELGMSNASSIGLPGIGTLRAGINIASPTPNSRQQTTAQHQVNMSASKQQSSLQSFNPPSPFSPAQRFAMQDTISSGASATLIKNGQSLISNAFDLTQKSSNSSIQNRIMAAQRQVQHL